MTLRVKTLIVIAAALACATAIQYGALRNILLESFARLEERDARRDVERALITLSETTSAFNVTARDYAEWDDTYAFIKDSNDDYVATNLTRSTFTTLRLNVVLFLDTSGRIVLAKAFDLAADREMPVPDGLVRRVSSVSGPLRHPDPDKGTAGIILLPENPILVASRAILTSSQEGPSRGTLIMGRFLDQAEVGRLAGMTHLPLELRPLDDAGLRSDLQALQAAGSPLSVRSPVVVRSLDPESLAGYALLNDIFGEPALVLKLDLPRVIYRQGRISILYSIASLLVAGLAFGATCLLLLERLVLARLSHLSSTVSTIGSTRDLSCRVPDEGNDELAMLGAAINAMLGTLQQGQDKLRESEERYRALIENQGEGIGILDAGGRITFANPAAHEILGLPPGALAGRHLAEFAEAGCPADLWAEEWLERQGGQQPPGKREGRQGRQEREEREERQEHRRRSTHELKVTRPDGEKRALLLTATPRFDGEGRFSGTFAIFRDITDLKRAEEQVRHLSLHDGLTGLFNRAYFEEQLKRLDRERRLPLSLIIGDLNGLKVVNDAFGHREGDRLLARTARLIAGCCRRGDVVCRSGGDEFAVLLPNTGEQAAGEVVARIRKACDRAPDDPIRPSIALAVATKEEASQRMDEVLKQAEDRMYRNKLAESKSARSSIVSSLRRTLGEKTYETEEHAHRLQEVVLRMGQALGLSDSQMDELGLLAVLHDIGKIAVPDSILTKAGPLTGEEWSIVRKHPEVGYRIAAFSEGAAPVAEAIRAHHERWDGAGYPRGLKDGEIPLTSRIIAIADTYDVMTQGRSYKKAVGRQEAIEEIKRCAGGQFDPSLVEVFVRLFSEEAA